jgi:hypothetical protein
MPEHNVRITTGFAAECDAGDYLAQSHSRADAVYFASRHIERQGYDHAVASDLSGEVLVVATEPSWQ